MKFSTALMLDTVDYIKVIMPENTHRLKGGNQRKRSNRKNNRHSQKILKVKHLSYTIAEYGHAVFGIEGRKKDRKKHSNKVVRQYFKVLDAELVEEVTMYWWHDDTRHYTDQVFGEYGPISWFDKVYGYDEGDNCFDDYVPNEVWADWSPVGSYYDDDLHRQYVYGAYESYASNDDRMMDLAS